MMWTVWFLSGLVLGIVFVAIARALGEQRVLSVGLVIATGYYLALAAIHGASSAWLGVEALGVVLYGVFAWLGVRRSLWWLAVGWLTHPIWDVALHLAGRGREFTPAWYPIQCVSFDLVVAAYIAYRLVQPTRE
jgi:hypothetical protein